MKAKSILVWAALATAAGSPQPSAHGAVTHAIQSLQNTNYTGYVIDADSLTLDPAHHHEHLRVQSRVRTTNPDAIANLVTYYLRYRLINSGGQPHPLYDSTGVLNANHTYNLTNSFGIAAGDSLSRTNLAALRPASRLDPGDTYTVELRIFLPGGLREIDSLTTAPQTFVHFTNLVSADPGFNVAGTVDSVTLTRRAAVNTDPNLRSFTADIEYTLHRYDNFSGASGPAANVPITISYQLIDNLSATPVPLAIASTNFDRALFNYHPLSADPPAPWSQTATRTIHVQPAAGVQLDPVDGRYRVVATVSHLEQAGVPASSQDGTVASSSASQFLHFNGELRFGSLHTRFSSLDNIPAAAGTVAGSHVNTTLSVVDQSGIIPGFPGVTYGDGTDLKVRLLANGDAVAESGDLPVILPPSAGTKVVNVRMDLLAPASLTPTGLVSHVRVHLPTGLGYRLDTAGRLLRRSFVMAAVPLGIDLRPVTDLTYAPGSALRLAEDSHPLWLAASALTWRVSEGRFDLAMPGSGAKHVRADEYARLDAVQASLDNPQRSLKRANDRYYNAVTALASPAFVEADARCVGRLTAGLTLGPGVFRTHFPYDARVRWNGGGTLALEGDQVVSEGSQLTGVEPVALSYGTGCTGVDCGPDATASVVRLFPGDGTMQFTIDGGLVAGGTVDHPHRLRWGYIASLESFAHEAFDFSQANFHMPGPALRGDQSGLSPVLRPAALLYTGVAATNLARIERPDGPGTANQNRYEEGFADYAGMNFAVGTDGARQGHSTLAGVPSGNYQLKGVAKYYARRGGVSGLHDAVSNTFPATLTLYGYSFDFADFGFNTLDNQMQDSHIDGMIEVPEPSGFALDFAGLRLNCLGGVENAPMPAPLAARPLAYWNGQFDALAVQFRRHPADLCNVTNAFLTVGAASGIAHVTEPLYGTLGFRPDGNLLPQSAGLPDLDSRLKLPNVIHLAGPRGETYVLNPVVDAYFNGHDQLESYSPDTGSAPSVGWVNFAATIDVPFFEDLRVHVQTSATAGNTNAPIHLLGGWPAHGWETDGRNFFTADFFDADNRGYANGTAPLAYRDSPTDEFHPRARRTWLNVIPFDYPLSWSSITRDFRSRAPRVNDLMVLRTENELKYLSAREAEITFGAQFDGLPQCNLANLAYQAIDFATSTGHDLLAGKLSEIVGGFGRLNDILSSDLQPFFGGIFDQRLQPKVDELYDQFMAAYDPAHPEQWLDSAGDAAEAVLQNNADSALQRLKTLVNPGAGQLGMTQRLADYLTEAEEAVAQVESILLENPEGHREIATELMRLLVDNLAAQFAGSFVDELVQPYLAEADPTLDQITGVLSGLRTALAQIRTTLSTGMGVELENLFAAHELELDGVMNGAMGGLGEFLGTIDMALDSPVADYSPDEIKHIIRREIEDRFYGTSLAAGIQVVHKQRLYDADAAIRQATDTVFQEVNAILRTVIGATAEELSHSFSGLLGSLEPIAAAAKVNGYAHINGDSLKEARVDLRARLDLGSSLEFNGYLQIKELDSQGSAGCSYPGTDSVTEVTLGAEDVQVGWISPDLRASVGTKFTFDDGGDHFPLRGLGGSFELTGKLEYEAFAINYLGAALALGADENFLSGAAGMRVNKYDVFGGIYFGRSCSVAPIELWDRDAAALLGNGSFTGIYGYGEGWIPINELIGIPASCLFNISAGLGVGAGVFLEGPTFVAKMKAGVSGEALCLIGVKGELTGTGVLEGLDVNVLDGLTIKAKGTVSGKVGPCPFCLGLEQSVALTFKQGQWKLDF